MKAARCTVALVAFGLAAWAAMAHAAPTAWEQYSESGKRAYQRGQYVEAEKLFSAALKEAEAFGSEDLHVATSLNDLGEVAAALGKYVQAESLHQRALAICQKAVGLDHPDVAESLHKRALSIREKVLGRDHPDVAAGKRWEASEMISCTGQSRPSCSAKTHLRPAGLRPPPGQGSTRARLESRARFSAQDYPDHPRLREPRPLTSEHSADIGRLVESARIEM